VSALRADFEPQARHYTKLGYVSGQSLHIVAACDETGGKAFVITAYEPSLEIFEADYRTKRKL
jgi:hypothetical protein